MLTSSSERLVMLGRICYELMLALNNPIVRQHHALIGNMDPSTYIHTYTLFSIQSLLTGWGMVLAYLINTTWNETWYIGAITKYMRK
jgi:hypothetical protein